AGMRVDIALDIDGDAEGVAMQAAALVAGRDMGQEMGGFEGEFFEQFQEIDALLRDHGAARSSPRSLPIGAANGSAASVRVRHGASLPRAAAGPGSSPGRLCRSSCFRWLRGR